MYTRTLVLDYRIMMNFELGLSCLVYVKVNFSSLDPALNLSIFVYVEYFCLLSVPSLHTLLSMRHFSEIYQVNASYVNTIYYNLFFTFCLLLFPHKN